VTAVVPAAAAPVTFTPKLRPDLIATIEQVERIALRDRTGAPTSGPNATPEATIIDARLTRFYNGDGGGYPRPGHIPTAVNVPLSSVSSNGYLKPVSELKTLFDAAGVDQGRPVITYCHIGQQATLLWFVATMLGLDARMYDGSFQEWSGSTRPVVGPPGT
jgi:thiosulfate/3-mercaptopyruvate sulfurtransferase